MGKRIISCAITGSIHSPSMSDALPYKPADIAQQALDAANAGAAVVHIHVRDPETGKPVSDMDIFGEVFDRIRTANKDVVICTTTGGGFFMSPEERVEVVRRFHPQMASMNSGSINWSMFQVAENPKMQWKFDWEKPYYESTRNFIFSNTFGSMEVYMNTFNECGTKPELEVYDTGHIYNIKWLIDKGLVKGKPFIQFVTGVMGGIGASPETIHNLKTEADRIIGRGQYEFSGFGAGRAEFPCCMECLLLGGHARVGLEDNLYLGKGRKASCNAELVEKLAKLMTLMDYEIASPQEAKEILGITK